MNAKERRLDVRRRLRKAGYEGGWKSLDELTSWLTDQGYAETDFIVIDGIKFETKKVVISADAGEEVEIMELPSEPEGEAMEDEDDEDVKMEDDDEPKKARGVSPSRKAAQKRATQMHLAAGVGSKGSLRFNADGAKRKAYEAKIRRGVGTGTGQARFSDVDIAEAYGAWARKTMFGDDHYKRRDDDERILAKAAITTTFEAGGALVPEVFEPFLIDLAEQRGLVRRILNFRQMSSDVLRMGRIVNGTNGSAVTVTINGETEAATETDAVFDNVSLVAFKVMALSKLSNEIANDAAINVADTLIDHHQRAHDDKIDDLYLNATGTSAQGGVVGIIQKLKDAGDGTPANAEGLHSGPGSWLAIDLDDIENMFGLLPDYAGIDNNLSIVCNRKFYWQVLVRLQAESFASSAVVARSNADVAKAPDGAFFGVPVIFSPRMPSTYASGGVPILLGNHDLASKAGEVSGTRAIDMSDQRYFDTDEIALRSKQRVALTPGHDVGDTSDSGAVVGLITS